METETLASEHPAWKWVVLVCQVSLYPILLSVRFILIKRNLIKGTVIETNNNPHVLYANHLSQLDPFLLCLSLPPKTALKLAPYRSLVANKYFKNPAMAFLLNLMGGFPAYPHPSKSYGLPFARQLLKSGQTIIIFPQGKLTREPIVKPGISALAMEPKVRLIPMYIAWSNHFSPQVSIGQPSVYTTPQPPEQLMQRVFDLAMPEGLPATQLAQASIEYESN